MDWLSQLETIESLLTPLGTPQRAVGEKKYLKSELAFLGVPVPVVRKQVKHFLKANGDVPTRDLAELAGRLFATDIHELRTFGVEILALRSGSLDAEEMERVEVMLGSANTWAHVDALAVHVAGGLLLRFPARGADLDRWVQAENFWLRRSAMLACLPSLRQGGDEWGRFSRYADLLITESEFFIRKAIGWVLREVSKRNPERVEAWVSDRIDRISGLSLREAVKYLDDATRNDLLGRFKSR